MAVVTNYILFLANSPKNFLSAPTHRPPPPPPAASPQLKIGSAMASWKWTCNVKYFLQLQDNLQSFQ